MAETYCGKSCAACEHRQALDCPGCKVGPGRQYSGDCELARCLRSKGHESCETCSFRGTCGTYRGRERMPEYRRREKEAEAHHLAAVADRSVLLGKWIWVLFWLLIPISIAGRLTTENMAQRLPQLLVPAKIIGVVFLAVYAVVLLFLSKKEERYRLAGICLLLSCCGNMLMLGIFGNAQLPPGSLLISIPTAVAALVAEYQEDMGHCAVLSGVDNVLSDSWEKLAKWNIAVNAAIVGSLLLVVISPLLGVLVILAAAIASLIVGILKLVYLYRTAGIFRRCAAQMNKETIE